MASATPHASTASSSLPHSMPHAEVRPPAARSVARTVVVVGAGNTGSHLLPHLVRMPSVGRVVVVDPDIYKEKNLLGQAIEPGDLGLPKAIAQARRLRNLRPDVDVVAIVQPFEAVPLGLLRADVLLGCTDSKASRVAINRAAWRIGVPWIDCGVDADSLLARVTTYVPGESSPCYECGFTPEQYALLSQTYPCAIARQAGTDKAATNAPSSLGALAASLQAIECQLLLTEGLPDSAPGREILIDSRQRRFFLTESRRNPRCRFDHCTWRIERVDRTAGALSLEGVLCLPQHAGTSTPACARSTGTSLGLEGMSFVNRLRSACGYTREFVFVAERVEPERFVCPECGGEMGFLGFDLTERLESAMLTPATRRLPLRDLGFRDGDVMSVTAADGVTSHYELSGGQEK